MAYVIERVDKQGKQRYVGMFKAANGKVKSAGTYDTHERAIEVATQEENHARGLLSVATPAEKAKTTLREFGSQRFLPHHSASPAARQGYEYSLKNHVYPYIGDRRVSELDRETFYNLLTRVLPSEDGDYCTQITVNAVRKALSALCQMALDEGYRDSNPLRSIRLPTVSPKPVLVANHEQWERLEYMLSWHRPAKLYARVNVATWARQCEMISLRPRDFDFETLALTISRSTIYITAKYHPSGKPGWVTKDHPKNGDWRRFTISRPMATALQEHIEEYDLDSDDVLFPQWMFAYRRPPTSIEEAVEKLPPLVTSTGIKHEHGTMGARFGLNCTCWHCREFAAAYQREYRRKQAAAKEAKGELTKANTWRRDGTEFLAAGVWGRIFGDAREAAGLPEDFTAYNARHTGISWAIAKGIDLQKIRQRAGHGSLSVTSRYAAILDEQDTSVADSFEEIFSSFEAG